MTSNHRVRAWSERFRETPLARRVVTGLEDRSAEIWQRTVDLLRQESPEYRNSIDKEFTQESKSHCGELLRAIIAIAAARKDRLAADPLAFVRTHAEWRARHQVPLIASLHAYRLAHKTYSGITRESLMRHSEREEALQSLNMLSDFWIEFFDHVGAVLAEAHAVEEASSVAQNTHAYISLINTLLHGIEPKGTDAQHFRTLCGIRQGAPMSVAIARPFASENGRRTDGEVAVRSLARLFHEVLPSAVFGKLIDTRNGEVTLIVAGEADTGRSLLKALRRHGFGRKAANGLAAGVGISTDVTDVTSLPDCLEEARIALEFASAKQPLIGFADIDLPAFLIRRADKAALRLIPERTRCLLPENGAQSTELSRTVRAFAESSFNVKQTARRLGIHTNSVYFRLNRIRALTGIDPRTFSGTLRLLTVLDLLDAHAASKR